MDTRRATAAVTAMAMAVGGCATSGEVKHREEAAAEGRESIRVVTYQYAEDPLGPGRGFGAMVTSPHPLPAECTAANDRGAWIVATPGVLKVSLSSSPLVVTCRREGYRDSTAQLRCVTPRETDTKMGALGGLQLVASAGPAAAYALPTVGVLLAVMAGAAAVGAATGNATSGPHADVCLYRGQGELRIWMQKKAT